jgi:very-short-patch-repair endonuclease
MASRICRFKRLDRKAHLFPPAEARGLLQKWVCSRPPPNSSKTLGRMQTITALPSKVQQNKLVENTRAKYNYKLIPYARENRREMTPAEKKLWYQFLRTAPVKFRRQRPAGWYILDFYCPEKKLVIEVDGAQHYTQEGLEYDAIRTAYLESCGLRVIRFTNRDVITNLAGVAEEILKVLAEP